VGFNDNIFGAFRSSLSSNNNLTVGKFVDALRPVALVHERTIPTERIEGCRMVSAADPMNLHLEWVIYCTFDATYLCVSPIIRILFCFTTCFHTVYQE
jgi:hypothetical protein